MTSLENVKLVLLIVLVVLFLFILIVLYYYIRRKGIGYKKYLDLMDLGDDLKAEIINFMKKKTSINFSFINLDCRESYDKIKCEWLNSEILISDKNKFTSEIKNKDNILGANYYINVVIKQKVELIRDNKRKEFIIDIYYHQNNNYYIITNIQKNQAYSLDIIYYSKDKDLIPTKLYFGKNELIIDDYNLDNMGRICLINIEKNSCINFINSISMLEINENSQIFENDLYDIFLNIKIKNKDLFKSSLFLNQKDNEVYDLSPKELDILKRFNKYIVVPYINKYKNFKDEDFNEDMGQEFINNVNKFILRNFSDTQELDNNDSIEEAIPLKKEEMGEEIMYDIIEPRENDNENKNDLHLNIKGIKEEREITYGSYQLNVLIYKFFNSPINRRYIDEPSHKDFEIVETLCYLKLSIMAKLPLRSFIGFYYFKKKILNEVKDFTMKEKIKIICCIQSHLTGFIPKKIQLQKMSDLPEYSPYLRGEILYRNIIKNLTEKSKLKFAFLQLNSGGGYDFVKKDNCYLLKMIPLIAIKSHLLNNSEDYFFTYYNNKSIEYAYIDPFTRIESINEIKVFDREDIAYKEDEDFSIKVGLLQFHEKGGHIKYGKKEKSPRFLISNEFDLFDNYSIESDVGESGNALEVILLGNSNYIATLMSCDSLKKLNNYKLFTDENGTNLLKEIKHILKINNATINIKDKKMININSRTIEGDKYSKLKSLEMDLIKINKKRNLIIK